MGMYLVLKFYACMCVPYPNFLMTHGEERNGNDHSLRVTFKPVRMHECRYISYVNCKITLQIWMRVWMACNKMHSSE